MNNLLNPIISKQLKKSDLNNISDKFTKDYHEYLSNNSLVTMIEDDENKVKFLLDISYQSYLTYKCDLTFGFFNDKKIENRFHPNPIDYFPIIYCSDIGRYDIDVFFEEFNNLKKRDMFINLGKSCGSDRELTKDLSIINTRLLYFFIMNCNVSFTSSNLRCVDGGYLFKVYNSEEKESDFYDLEQGDGVELLHGTCCFNLYSITKNGIKSMSETEFMSSGSAYGSGVYLSKSCNTAFSYGTYNSSTSVLIFKAKKLNNVSGNLIETPEDYYVQQESDIILKFIYWCPNVTSYDLKEKIDVIYKNIENNTYIKPKLLKDLKIKHEEKSGEKSGEMSGEKSGEKSNNNKNDYFSLSTLEIKEESKINPFFGCLPKYQSFPKLKINKITSDPYNSLSVMNSSRMKKEIVMFKSEFLSNDLPIVRYNFHDESDIRSPILFQIRAVTDTKLDRDLKRINLPGFVIAMYFPEAKIMYPFAPPIIRVLSPRFKKQTGHVMLGGSICMDSLFKDGFSPQKTLASYIKAINNLVCTSEMGPGELDFYNNEEYTFDSYKSSQNDVAYAHNWKSF